MAETSTPTQASTDTRYSTDHCVGNFYIHSIPFDVQVPLIYIQGPTVLLCLYTLMNIYTCHESDFSL